MTSSDKLNQNSTEKNRIAREEGLKRLKEILEGI